MKYFQLIHLGTTSADQKQRLMDTLLIHKLTCFGVGQHLVVIDEKPEGAQKIQSPDSVLRLAAVRKIMRLSQATLITFGKQALKSIKKYLSKEYVFKGKTKNSVTYHSKTQSASFTLYRNGRIKTSKDLLDVALMSNLVRLIYGKQPINPQV